MPEESKYKEIAGLSRFSQMFEEGAFTKSEAQKFLKTIMEYVLKLDQRQEAEIQTLRQAVSQLMTKIEGKFDIKLTELHKEVDGLFVGNRVKKIEDDHFAKMKGIDERMAKVKDGQPGMRGERGPMGLKGDPGIISLEVAKQALKQPMEEFAKNWDDKVQGLISSKRMAGASPHNLTQVFNASSQVDGFKRIFTGLPTARHYPMAFFRGQNPVALAADIDYSIGRNSITLLGHVEPPTSGTNFYILYIR